MGVRIGQDPGELSKLDTPHWDRNPGGLRDMEQRLQQAEQQEKYKSTNYDAAHITKTPTAAQLAEINEHIRKGENQEALDKTVQYWGIDTKNVNGKVTFDATLNARGDTDKDRNVRIGPQVFNDAGHGAAATAATVLHEVTHANQVKGHGYPSEHAGWSNARMRQEFASYEAMGYQAALTNADTIGLNADQKKWYEDKVTEYKDKLTPENRRTYDAGQYWDMK